jgi:hypothetical protein
MMVTLYSAPITEQPPQGRQAFGLKLAFLSNPVLGLNPRIGVRAPVEAVRT